MKDKGFNYQWWTVSIQDESGVETWEFKAKSKQNVINQINKEVRDTNSIENANRDFWHRRARILNVFWETLTLNRVGYQRRF